MFYLFHQNVEKDNNKAKYMSLSYHNSIYKVFKIYL
jgi:hypothetical protein